MGAWKSISRPGFHIFWATKGFDILDNEFNATQARKESFLSIEKKKGYHLALFGQYDLNKKQSLDSHLSRVVDGENTGEENSFSLAFTHKF